MSPSRRRTTLARAAVRLAGLIGTEDCVLVGGLAVGAHGYVRATDDIDMLGRRPLPEIRDRLRKAGIETRTLRGDVLDGGFSCVKGEIDGIPFDILPPLVPIAWGRAIPLEMAGGTLRVVDLDSLLQLKFRAGGPQDLLDAARLVLRHPEVEPRATELATAYGARDQFEAWLRHPRTAAQAREDAEREARRAEKRARAVPRRRGT